jgi:hypothetical protein
LPGKHETGVSRDALAIGTTASRKSFVCCEHGALPERRQRDRKNAAENHSGPVTPNAVNQRLPLRPPPPPQIAHRTYGRQIDTPENKKAADFSAAFFIQPALTVRAISRPDAP